MCDDTNPIYSLMRNCVDVCSLVFFEGVRACVGGCVDVWVCVGGCGARDVYTTTYCSKFLEIRVSRLLAIAARGMADSVTSKITFWYARTAKAADSSSASATTATSASSPARSLRTTWYAPTQSAKKVL